ERAIRGAEFYWIAGRENERGERCELIRRHDADVVSVGDALRRAQHVGGVLHERPRRRRRDHAGRRSDPDGKVPNVVGRELVGFELHRAVDPSAFRRRGAQGHLFVRRRGAAAERAAIERHAIRRRILREEARSEEHTSELQSLAYLVCRLLLEKKKKNIHLFLSLKKKKKNTKQKQK